MDLRRQLSVLRHWAWLIILSAILGGGASYVISSSLPGVYEARARLIVGQSLTSVDPDYTQLLASQRLSQTYAQVAETRPILSAVVQRLSLDLAPDELADLVRADAPRESTLITITAQDADPVRAAEIANAIADEVIAISPAIQGQQSEIQRFVEDQLAATQLQIQELQTESDELSAMPSRNAVQEARLATVQDRLTTLRQTYSQLLVSSTGSAANLLTVIEPAVPSAEPAAPRVLVNTLLAGMVGIVLAVGLAFLIEYLDDTVKAPDHVTNAIGVPTLGVITRMKPDRRGTASQRLMTVTAPRSAAAEAYRALRTNLEFASVDAPLESVLVTSAIPGEGKTTTAANIAVAFAQAGRRVLLLDADMRRPGVHRMFELPNLDGLTNLLRSEETSLASVAHVVDPNLRIVTTGPLPPNPAELLASKRMDHVLKVLLDDSDLLVLDSPPLHAVTDAAILASRVTGTLIVIDAGRTRRGALRQAREALDRVGARLLGAVLNRVSERARGGYYYYSYGEYSGAPQEVNAATSSDPRGAADPLEH